ncbi:MAG: phosphoribosylamine--glycine ligase [Methanobacteriota archaeon]|nr:MAG: phosphoribosylamine--glycine ligase [Euryarchaeota archaeon]
MKVLAVGGGGREHAIVEALVRSGANVYACMKNSNPGIRRAAVDCLLADETGVAKVVEYATGKGVSLAVIGPEAPLEKGLADSLEAAGIPTASPSRAAAMIETSKVFARELMLKHGIAGRAKFIVARDVNEAELALDELGEDIVVKPEGLTGGKGVKVFGEHLRSREEAIAYSGEILERRIGGSASLVIEEKLVGEEFTLQAFCDGKRLAPMPAVQDHKRAFEGDQGPNTGGMGSYSQAGGLLPFLSQSEYDSAVDIMRRTVEALGSEGAEYKGALYGQFMLTREGPKVVEFNARFGDPEAMNTLSIFDDDFVSICEGMAGGSLSSGNVSFAPEATVCKYIVPEGYGVKPLSGQEIQIDERAVSNEGALLYYANVNEEGGRVYTTTSRAAGVVGVSEEIEEAESVAERAIRHITGRIAIRHDIGTREMLESRVRHMQEIRGASG